MSPRTPLHLITFLIITLLASAPGITIGQQHNHLSMQLQFADTLVHVQAQYRAIVEAETDSAFFMLNPGFDLKGISAEGLEGYALGQKPNRPFPFWLLKFGRKIQAGETMEVQFEYAFDLQAQNHLKSNWIELNVDKFWFPNYHDMDTEFTYDVTIEGFPESFSLVGHGNAVITEKESVTEIVNTEPTEEVLILAGGNMKFWSQEGSPITIFAHESTSEEVLTSIAGKVQNSIDLLNESFGAADPITDFTVVLRNTPQAEIGFQFNRGEMIITGTYFDNYADLSHEIAHYWWSGADFIHEPWLNESFAKYSMYLVLEEFAPEVYTDLFDRNAERASKAIPVARASLFVPEAYPSFYFRGAHLLKKLEERIGREQMKSLLAARIEEEVNTTKGFLGLIEKQIDRETRLFFEDLLQK